MPVEIRFDMPYSLRVNGNFTVNIGMDEFQITLLTHFEENPRVPGMEFIQNISIVNDNTNIISHTKVVARYEPSDLNNISDHTRFDVASVAMSIANTLVSATRAAYKDYFFDYIYAPKQIGQIFFSVSNVPGVKNYAGSFDPVMGGLTFHRPPRSGSETSKFQDVLIKGLPLPVSQELYFEARRYLLGRNNRMALANLVISFEVNLADNFSKVALSRGDRALERRINSSTLGELGQRWAKQILGQSLENKDYWGSRFSDTYAWLRKCRNGVLHKAHMSITHDSVTRDFSLRGETQALFTDHDWLKSEVETAVSRVITGHPPKP